MNVKTFLRFLSALVVVMLDRLVIRRVRRLRSVFGMPATTETKSPS